jgi:hypothetical protein
LDKSETERNIDTDQRKNRKNATGVKDSHAAHPPEKQHINKLTKGFSISSGGKNT